MEIKPKTEPLQPTSRNIREKCPLTATRYGTKLWRQGGGILFFFSIHFSPSIFLVTARERLLSSNERRHFLEDSPGRRRRPSRDSRQPLAAAAPRRRTPSLSPIISVDANGEATSTPTTHGPRKNKAPKRTTQATPPSSFVYGKRKRDQLAGGARRRRSRVLCRRALRWRSSKPIPLRCLVRREMG